LVNVNTDFPAGQHPDRPTHTTAPLYVARQRAKRDGFTLIEGSCFWADPSVICAMVDYEEMRDEILGQLKAALPLDGVLLGLHGAMVAHGYDDCEGDILEHVRALVGSQVPIGVELDPHCHLTEKRVRLANAIILYKEYPHIDFVERAGTRHHRQDHPRRDQAGDVALRLPDDRAEAATRGPADPSSTA
jgi:microcystin degradation protein MlrC